MVDKAIGACVPTDADPVKSYVRLGITAFTFWE